MSRLRVGLLVNPVAGNGSANAAGEQVARLLRVAGLSVVDVSARTARIAYARTMDIRSELTALIVVGGDGAVSLGASIVAGTPVRLGIVAAGTGNDTARSLGLPINQPGQAVKTLLHCLSQPALRIDSMLLTSLPEDIGQITTHHFEPAPYDGLAIGYASLGFDAVVNRRANSLASLRSLRYPAAVIREVAAFKAHRYWLEIDGGPRVEIDAVLIGIANAPQIGGGMRMVPQALLADGQLQLITIGSVSRREMLRLLPRVYSGSHISHPAVSVQTVRESIRIGVTEPAAMEVYADGERRTVLPVQISVNPASVAVLAPYRSREDRPAKQTEQHS